MAVIFKSHDTGLNFLIGGQSSLTGADAGHAGTMPTYDITREEMALGDGTHVGFRYNITVVGTATSGASDVSTTKGAAQAAIQELANQDLQTLNPPNTKQFGNGKLEIAPYGGYEDIISFNDARLISVDLAEQDEETAGTQYLNYTFTFEAYQNTSSNGSTEPTWLLKTASESWDLSEGDEFTYDEMKIGLESNKYKTYTLTHTLSAEGIRKYNSTEIDPEEGHAWKQAANWVRDRLSVSETLGSILEDLMGNSDELETSFNPKLMNAAGDTKLIDLITDGYLIRNKTRTINSDIGAGSYSVTDSYVLIKGDVKAYTSVETSIQNTVEQDTPIQITVNGTVTGLSVLDVDSQVSHDKYTNARTEYNKLFTTNTGGNAYTILQTKIGYVGNETYQAFDAVGYKYGALFRAPLSFTETHDKTAGSINWSIVFTDGKERVNGAYASKVTVSYSNDARGSVKPVAIPVIANGPYIHLPNTTDEQTATFNVELKMLKSHRTAPPDGKSAISPSPEARLADKWDLHEPRITSRSDSWNPITGVYTLQLVYTYA